MKTITPITEITLPYLGDVEVVRVDTPARHGRFTHAPASTRYGVERYALWYDSPLAVAAHLARAVADWQHEEMCSQSGEFEG